MAVDDTVAVLVDVDACGLERRRGVEQHAKADGLAARLRTQHEMKIARVKTKNDLAVRLRRERLFLADVPPAFEPPLIDAQPAGRGVSLVVVALDVFGRRPVFLPQ